VNPSNFPYTPESYNTVPGNINPTNYPYTPESYSTVPGNPAYVNWSLSGIGPNYGGVATLIDGGTSPNCPEPYAEPSPFGGTDYFEYSCITVPGDPPNYPYTPASYNT
ncbi:MAG TPA: hypothetical protein DEB23_04645, partial [Chitinophagaceae bacterium]|nr:hypothetical protein [Chitinophagaceae bacterium]